ncbi:MAG: PorV/PorQ family protein [Bacteroidales bacterium]|nr:PorV/PorQ family protein [Bacteroidales bacterium]
MRNSLLLFFFTLLVYQLNAQAPKYSNEFLAIGVGARALAMSNSVVASNNDVYSSYWNPAGLIGLKTNREISLMHSEYFAGIAKYDFGAIAFKLSDKSAASVSLIRFGVDDIPNTSELIDGQGNINYDKVSTFSAADYALILSYARLTNIEGLTVGGNAKIIHRIVGDFGSSWGFGIDLSAQYVKDKWLMGVMLRDITTTFNAWSYNLDDKMKEAFSRTGNTIPKNSTEITLPKVILGIGRTFSFGNNFDLLTEVNFDITTDGKRNVLIKANPISVDPHLGLEFGYKRMIFLRAGVGNVQQETMPDNIKEYTFQPNIGLGVVIKKVLSIDYAFTDIGNQSIALYSNVFSLKYSFNSKKIKDK